jgi:hypothetical protein
VFNNSSSTFAPFNHVPFWNSISCQTSTLANLFFSQKYTPPPSEPESDASPWPPQREIRIHERFGAVHGTYPLYDLLEITTQTGAVHVTIEPKSGNKTGVVRISSKTGAIHASFAKSTFSNNGAIGANDEKSISERAYSTTIEAITGQIHADVVHAGPGSETVLKSNTGMLNLEVTPLADNVARIDTSTRTGLSNIKVHAPVNGGALRNLTAVHKSRGSGMLNVKYPSEWEGRLHAWCEGTGRVDVRGDGLNFQGGGTDVYAWRGKDAAEKGKIIDVVSEGTGMVSFKA